MKRTRRQSLQAMIGTLGVVALPRMSLANQTQISSIAMRFEQKVAKYPWLNVFQNAGAEHFPSEQATLYGKWPQDLEGRIFRTGPGHFERNGHRYQHWFDGDGLVQKWHFNGSSVHHQAQMVGTQKYLAEQQKDVHLYDAFGTHLGLESVAVTQPDDLNTANTSMCYHGNQLWALWEAGSPHKIDQSDLSTVGVKSFSAMTEGIAFSAHPRTDQKGHLWNFGYISGLGKLALWEISKNGQLQQFALHDVDEISMPHDFLVTENYLVLLNSPLVYNPEKAGEVSFLDSHDWHPELPTQVIVINKNDLNESFTVELPAQWVFHFTNAWEKNSEITFEGCSYEGPAVMTEFFSQLMEGKPTLSDRFASNLTRYRIDLKTRSVQQETLVDRSHNLEFPTIDRRQSAIRHTAMNCLSASRQERSAEDHMLLNTLVRMDMVNDQTQQYVYPPTEIPEEHLFVPSPNRSRNHTGWVLGTSLDWKENKTKINVFDSEHISDGPLATASVDRLMPLGLHGCYVH